MKKEECFKRSVINMKGYTAGEQMDDPNLIRLNANENSFPTPEFVLDAIKKAVSGDLRFYPDESASGVRKAASRVFNLPVNQIIVENGSSSLLLTIFNTIIDPGDRIAVPSPTFTLYRELAQVQNGTLVEVPFLEKNELPIDDLIKTEPKLIIIVNPNAPTGHLIPIDKIEELLKRFEKIVVVDEAYAEFAEDDAFRLLKKYPNLIITRTFSKSKSLAGLRISLGFSSEGVIDCLNKVRTTYNVNTLSQAAAISVLDNWDKFKDSIDLIKKEKESTSKRLSDRGFEVLPSQTNFVLVKIPFGSLTASKWEEKLKEKKILIRYFPKENDLSDFLRISIGTSKEMDALFKAIDEFLS